MPITNNTYIGKQCVKKHIEKAVNDIFSQGEFLLGAYHGQVMSKGGMSLHDYLLVTNQRVIFWDRGIIGGSTHSFLYSNISSVEEAKGLLLGAIVLNIRGTKERFRNMVKTDVPKAAYLIRDQISLQENMKNTPVQAQESKPDKIQSQDFDLRSIKNKCPKCSFEYENDLKECPRCGIIFSKYRIIQTNKNTIKQQLLSECRVCGQKISKRAEVFPKCGESNDCKIAENVALEKIIQPKKEKPTNNNLLKKRFTNLSIIHIIGIIVTILIAFLFIFGEPPKSKITPTKSDPGQLVTKNEFGEKWAFNVEEGYVYSIDKAAIFKAGGIEYQLNGVAKMKGYKSIDPIWRNNPDIPGTKINIGPFIELALNNPK